MNFKSNKYEPRLLGELPAISIRAVGLRGMCELARDMDMLDACSYDMAKLIEDNGHLIGLNGRKCFANIAGDAAALDVSAFKSVEASLAALDEDEKKWKL